MDKKIYPIILSFILLGSIFLSNASASDISLIGSIGVHTFNDNDDYSQKGSFYILNQADEDVFIRLKADNNIKSIDMGPNGEPRKHIVSNKVYFHPLEDTDWIEFEKDEFVIPAKSNCTVNYTLNITNSELPSYIDNKNGFICYINIVSFDGDSGSAANVGVNYNFKLFTIFNGDFGSSSSPFVFELFHIILIILSVIFLIYLLSRLRLKLKEVKDL